MADPVFVAFDIEITEPFPSEGDWRTARPLGISCAATLDSLGELRHWHGPQGSDGRLASRMAPAGCQGLARELLRWHAKGIPIVTWNGLGFDFDILVEECGEFPERRLVVDLALHHVDIAFAMLCHKGFMVGLEAAAKGMGLRGKTPGMRAELAPIKWAQGRAEQEQVLRYVAQDVRTTADVYLAVLLRGRLDWISRSGRPNSWPLPGRRLPNVSRALRLPQPDTSWMSKPWPRSRFYGWTGWSPGTR